MLSVTLSAQFSGGVVAICTQICNPTPTTWAIIPRGPNNLPPKVPIFYKTAAVLIVLDDPIIAVEAEVNPRPTKLPAAPIAAPSRSP